MKGFRSIPAVEHQLSLSAAAEALRVRQRVDELEPLVVKLDRRVRVLSVGAAFGVFVIAAAALAAVIVFV